MVAATTGTPFTFEIEFPAAQVKYPFAPSIDRHPDPFAGYRDDNVRLISSAVIFGHNQWGSEVYQFFAKQAVAGYLPSSG